MRTPHENFFILHNLNACGAPQLTLAVVHRRFCLPCSLDGGENPELYQKLGQYQNPVASPQAHNFISICYLCIMKTEQLLRCIFPEILADYFDVIDIQENISQIDFWLDERNFMEEADRKAGIVSSYGFTAERVVQDFPLRGKPVYLHVRRRKWRDSSTGEIFSCSYDDLTAEGSKLSPEFVSFLKE